MMAMFERLAIIRIVEIIYMVAVMSSIVRVAMIHCK